jgi:hypothetical protein
VPHQVAGRDRQNFSSGVEVVDDGPASLKVQPVQDRFGRVEQDVRELGKKGATVVAKKIRVARLS